ncbi:MAG: alcohol dehydrogenase catalytic domain-containing protein [Chitinivibrionales bacterium]
MKSAQLIGKKHFEILDAPVPFIRQGQVLVAIKAVGICASDLHYYTDGRIGNQICAFPQVLGHECSGTIAQTVRGSSFHEGDRVAVEPGLPCGKCEHCKSGHFNLCPDVKFLGMPGMPGAFQEFLALDEKQITGIPDSVSFDEAALLEPMGVACHANVLARIQKNETIAVFGAGAIGLLTLAIAKEYGAGESFIFDEHDFRLSRAKNNFYADHAVNVRDIDPIDYIQKHTDRRGVDVSFEAAGTPESFESALEAARIGGRALIIGIPAQDRISFNAHSLRRRELLVQNVRRSNGETWQCIDLLNRGCLKIGNLATHHFPLERIGEAFDVAAEYKDNVVRAMITF